MKQTFVVLIFFILSACNAENNDIIDFKPIFSPCEENSKKTCINQDFTAPSPRDKSSWLCFLAAEGCTSSDSGLKILDPQRTSLDINNKELDMNNHVWDFRNQKLYNKYAFSLGEPSLNIFSNNSIIKNGVILRSLKSIYGISISEKNYVFESFRKNLEENHPNNAKNIHIINMKIQTPTLFFSSKHGKITNTNLNLFGNLVIEKTDYGVIKDNHLISKNGVYMVKLDNENITSKSKFINKALATSYPLQINVSNSLYVKSSPNTIIDGNTFTLTHKNDQAYAIVLDHSPRVRITNNTFNGFKVPILMDQWSSIVDENGKEIKPENFNAYGNTINPNKYAGNVTMNRKGEIVKE